MKVFKIRGSLKNYEWGKIGLTSTVAQLQKSAFSDFNAEEIPYAELWMGTHISGPASVPSLQEIKLIDWIQSHPVSLGKNITNLYEASKGLPYLFKVLSVRKALSIQVHPDKESAVRLHKEFPEHYPDDNHKPEMAIALTNFNALCGFRPLSEIKEFFLSIPPLKFLVDKKNFDDFTNSPSEGNLKLVFRDLMTCSTDTFGSLLIEIVENFKEDTFKSNLCQSIRELFLEVNSQYPDDIGCFCLFFLNYLQLRPGEAIFLAANEPHAYLSGDCIECMACSDNVVRAGLTPKFKDVKTLCDLLTYKCKSAKENFFLSSSDSTDPYIKIYNPPVNEFAIHAIELPVSCNNYLLKAIDSASILLVVQGTATYKCDEDKGDLCRGSILFISSSAVINIEPKTDLLMYRSHCDS